MSLSQTSDFDLIEEPLLEGETIQRRYVHRYLEAARTQRKGPIDFRVISRLKLMILPYAGGNWALEEAVKHLENAENENLPLEAREQHFDIAFRRVWDAMTGYHSRPPYERMIHTFYAANGV